MQVLKVGIIGYGLSGRVFHGAVIKGVEGFEVTKIVTSDPVKRAQAIEDFKGVQVVESPKDVMDDPQIDLVIVCTPNTSHKPLAEEALRKGKHVVIEKPFTVTLEDAVELMVVAQEMNRCLSVYQNRRFDGDFKTLKRVISENKLGRIVEFESHFDRFRNQFKGNAWREEAYPGSGTLYDLGSHLIDQALCLFGLPKEVYGDIRAQRRGVVDDQFEVILYYDELKVTLKASNLVKEPWPRYMLMGTEGTFVKYGLDVQESALREGKISYNDQWGQEPDQLHGILNTLESRETVVSEKGDYREYYQALYESIVNNAPLPVTAEEGANVIKIIHAAIESNREKRRVEL